MLENRADAEKEYYSFSDLIDIDTFSRLLENFFKATGIPNGLVGPEGELLTQAGWSDACALFHRAHLDTKRQCEESNLELMQKLRQGEVAGCLCKNGLYDYATPVVIEGRQLATLFLGQVFDGPPDLEFFRQRARQFGYDEEAYLDAIRAVPVVSKAQMEAQMEAMTGVTQILAANGLARLRETRLRLDLDRSTEQRIQMKDLLEFSPVGISWCDAKGNIEYVNRQFTELFGYTRDDLPDLKTWIARAYPDAEYRKELFEPWTQRVESARHLDLKPPDLESTITCKDGSKLRVMTRVSWVGDTRLANFTDITAHWQSEQRNRAHNTMLQMVAKAEPLSNILYTLAQAVEAESPSSLCSILLLDQEGTHLSACAAPSLPSFYIDAVNGIEIGMGVQSCGTAAYLGKRVIVEDISTHEFWHSTADLAKKAGLAACWSEPIIGSDGRVLGTFAIFHTEPAKPSMEDIERLAFAANLAAIAIENRNTRETLIRREREFRSLAENAPDNIARYDTEARFVYANPQLAKTLGLQADQMLGLNSRELFEDDRFEFYDSMLRRVLESGDEQQLEITHDTPRGAETHQIHMVAEHNESGEITGVLAIGRNITERKQLEEQLAARERDFRTLAENVPLNIARYDRDGRMIYANPELVVNFPVPIEQILGKLPAELPELPNMDIFLDAIAHTIKSGEESSFEMKIPSPEGSFATHLITIVAERDETGEVVGALSTGMDISERKQLEEQLAAREREFRTLADNAAVNIARFDRGGRLIYANPKLTASLPHLVDQIRGKRIDEHLELPFAESFQKAIDHTLETGEESSFEALLPGLDGSEETHLINMVAERDESEAIVGTLVIGQDISDRKRLEEQLAAREREFRTLADTAPVNIARYDRDGRLIYANPKLAATLPEVINKHMGKLLKEQPELPFTKTLQKALDHTIETGEQSSFEALVPIADGSMATHLISMAADRDESGAIVGALSVGLDITERKQLMEQLAESERDFRTLAENVPINIARFDREGQLVYVNSRLAVTFPLPIHQLLGTYVSEEGRQPYSDLVQKSVLRTLEDGMERSFEIEIPIAGDGYVTHLISMVSERDESNSIVGVLATGMDISERKKLQRELERQARLDFLSGLLNRRYFIELAKMELSRLQRYGGELSLIMFDIDHFKGVNDTHGHKVGDQVLQKIAQVSHDTMREIDIIGRLGGEEFVVLLPHTNRQQAIEAAERLRLAIANGPVLLKTGEPLHFTASFGVVTIDGGPESKGNIDELLIRADKAMYQAKQEGRNRVCEDS